MEDLSNFVEGFITGIVVEHPDKIVSIFLLYRNQCNFVLKAEGVEKFVANEMREQNIIDRINVWDKQSDESSFRPILAALISGQSEYDKLNEAFLPLIDLQVNTIRNEGKILIEIEPVYGASVMLLARKISLRKL